MPQPKGRNKSAVRTPLWVRDYLDGRSSTLAPDLADSAPVDPTTGDYVGRMHQRLKAYILLVDPAYQYPRRHSFGALVRDLMTLGLLEKTGAVADPVERLASWVLQQGSPREPVRLTAGSAERVEWLGPVKYLEQYCPSI